MMTNLSNKEIDQFLTDNPHIKSIEYREQQILNTTFSTLIKHNIHTAYIECVYLEHGLISSLSNLHIKWLKPNEPSDTLVELHYSGNEVTKRDLEKWAQLYPNLEVLEIEELKVYGTPWCELFAPFEKLNKLICRSSKETSLYQCLNVNEKRQNKIDHLALNIKGHTNSEYDLFVEFKDNVQTFQVLHIRVEVCNIDVIALGCLQMIKCKDFKFGISNASLLTEMCLGLAFDVTKDLEPDIKVQVYHNDCPFSARFKKQIKDNAKREASLHTLS
jgi:hypothetical protein